MTDSTPKKLVDLYQQMADLTKPECQKVCRVPLSCCDPMYCEISYGIALSRGVTLEPDGSHPTLLFMGKDGCTVPPHLRPICTLHTCEVNSWGCKRNDAEWTRRYFELRDQIEEEESKI